MNRPTIDVDDLLELADEAISAGDQPQAIAILRRATSVAPLRKDIRNRLALVLEGTPIQTQAARRVTAKRAEPISFEMDDDSGFVETEAEMQASGLDSISLIAKKAFDAAAQQKAKAGDATKRLTNLLQSGLGSWKSTMAAQAGAKPQQVEQASVEAGIQSAVFRPEEELKQYLERTALEDSAPEEAEDEIGFSKISKPSPVSQKAARTKSQVRNTAKRPTDVEDVLAAGIGGFIEAIGRMEKTKLVYGIIYTALIAFFGFACYDVSRKFPGLSVTGATVQAASLAPESSAGQAESISSEEAIKQAKELAAAGKTQEAIDVLSAQLSSGRLLLNRDLIRVELASLLNVQAEAYLKANDLENSVDAYRKALSHLPSDARLQLRLANALYYYGAMGGMDKQKKKQVMDEASTLISDIISGDAQNIQAHRLNALVHESLGNKSSAKAAWQKVKTLAPADSTILAEAKTHLK